jgi:hypothetical protein
LHTHHITSITQKLIKREKERSPVAGAELFFYKVREGERVNV